MPRKLSHFGQPAVALAAGCLLGALLSKWFQPPTSSGPLVTSATSSDAQSLSARQTAPKSELAPDRLPVGKSIAAPTSVADIARLSSGAQRDQAWRDYLHSKPLTEFHAVMLDLDAWMRQHMDIMDNNASTVYATSIATITDVMAERDPAEAMTTLTEVFARPDSTATPKTDELNSFLRGVFRKWADTDPQAAFDFIQKNRSTFDQQNEVIANGMISDLVKETARNAPHTAFDWIKQFPSEYQQDLTRHALGAMAQSDPAYATELFKNNPDLGGRDVLAAQIADVWSRQDPAAAFQWAASLDASLNSGALPFVLDAWLDQEPETAWKAFQSLNGSTRDAALPAAARKYSGEGDYAKAAALLETEPVGPGRAGAQMDLMANWTRDDPIAATTWLADKLPPDASLDGSIRQVGQALQEIDPEASALWVNAIKDPVQRRTELSQAVQAWFKQSPGDALRWIQNSDRIDTADRRALTALFPQFFQPQ